MKHSQISLAIICLVIALLPAMALAQEDPYDWRSELDIPDSADDDTQSDFEWSNWDSDDWEEKFEEDYEHYYNSEESKQLRDQAYDQATDQGFDMPQRKDNYTYDPEKDKIIREKERDYIKRLNRWIDNIQDEMTEVGKDVVLDLLYKELEPVLKGLKQKNSALLAAILPQMGGVPVHDPAEDYVKENHEGKHNFKYWVKLAAENIMQSLFRKNAEGKYELQREKVELLKQVGIIRFLKMCATDWEVMQSFTLEVPDEVLDYARTLQDIYRSGTATFQAGKELYREIQLLDTELNIPAQLDQLRSLSKDIATNKLTIAEMVSKRRQLLALTYRQLATRYQQYGDDLNRQLKQEQQLKLSDAERIKALQIAGDYLDESLCLKAKAEALMTESYQPAKDIKAAYVARQALYKKLDDLY